MATRVSPSHTPSDPGAAEQARRLRLMSEAGEATRRLRLLRGVRWDWRDDAPAEALERPGMGVIAQEVEAVFPELIEPNEEGIRQVEYDGLVAPLLLAVTGIDARLRALEGEGEEGSEVVAESDQARKEGREGATERVARVAGTELRTELDPDQVEKVFPELVILDEEGEREVAYEGLVGLLIEAVRELDRRVAALEEGEDA